MDDDTDEKDDSKRKSRNLSEKKRRDQFNLLINELSSMVSSNNRKMDKSTVLKSTIAFLKNHNEIAVRSRIHEIQEDWKPSFLSNEEFTHLMLEALDGFIIVFSTSGKIIYTSESITSLLGYLPSELLNMTIYGLSYEEDHADLYNLFLNPTNIADPLQNGILREHQIVFTCHIRRGGVENQKQISYELIQFTGYFRNIELENILPNSRIGNYNELDNRIIFVGTGRLQTPQLIREMSIIDSMKSEFTSRHSLEWKFLFLDHRAPPIIGYLPFEVLGTSGYDYYHFDDLEKVVACHEALLQKGEGTSCYYRFLTKGQQWIWLQTRFYITYHQWNSKPEFIVCTHRVINYSDVMKQTKDLNNENTICGSVRELENHDSSEKILQTTSAVTPNSPWNQKNSRTSSTFSATPSTSSIKGRHKIHTYRGTGSDSTSISTDSIASQQSILTQHSSRSKIRLGSQSSKSHHSLTPQPLHIHTPTIQNQPHSIGSRQSQNSPQTPINHHHHHPTAVQLIPTTYPEPTQYLAAIPVQPVITPAFSADAALISPIQSPPEYLNSGVVMASTQSQIQDQLQRKHEELQHLIVQQKEELRKVSEQLLMARYGLLPTIVNVSVPVASTHITTNTRCVNNTQLTTQHDPSQQHLVHLDQNYSQPQQIMPTNQSEMLQTQMIVNQTDENMLPYMSYPTNPTSQHSSIRLNNVQSSMNVQQMPQLEQLSMQQQQQPSSQTQQNLSSDHQPILTELATIPYQMSQTHT